MDSRTKKSTRTYETFPRRDFLRAAGFSLGASLLSACERTPIENAIPYLVDPEHAVPGEALHYATVCGGCPAGCGLLAKTVDGRPIKLEGNPDHPISRGGLCAIGQASILELYDSERISGPKRSGVPISWKTLNDSVAELISAVRKGNQKVYFFSDTMVSPSEKAILDQFLSTFESAEWVSYDVPSAGAILEAFELTHGQRLLPHFQFDRAETILGLNADFLGTWISPVEFAQGYRDGRSLEGSRLRFSHHVQFESRLTITGAKADERHSIAPYEFKDLLISIAASLSRRAGRDYAFPESRGFDTEIVEGLVNRLWQTRGRSLVICGLQDIECQILTNLVNELLGNYRRTIDLFYPSMQRAGDERKLEQFFEDLESQKIGAVFFARVNPVYDLPFKPRHVDALQRIPCSVCFTRHITETSERVEFVCPEPHFLESWCDSAPTSKVLSIQQPLLSRLGDTRTLSECFSRWAGNPSTDLEILKSYWKEVVFPRQAGFLPFEDFWNKTLHDGVATIRPLRSSAGSFNHDSVNRLTSQANLRRDILFFEMYPKVHIQDGRHASNPWLQELPDPITKISWGNYLLVSPKKASDLEVKNGDIVEIRDSGGETEVSLPVLIQPGQNDSVIAAAFGYGGKQTERFSTIGPDWLEAEKPVPGHPVGSRVSGFLDLKEGRLLHTRSEIRITVSPGERVGLVYSQSALSDFPEAEQMTNKGREIVRTIALDQLLSKKRTVAQPQRKELWSDDFRYSGHHWAMTIDMEACTGCSACIVACQAENNIPVVGPDESRRKRSMRWLRVDRYYTQQEEGPEVNFQAMLCQHCDQAPCESVCPVLATVHSDEGLSQQIYNRCVGTRYCSNNCPYKVRAFNWFDYGKDPSLENLQLNPDVTLRTRGVMEKCSFCVQRILKAKLASRREGRELNDGEIQPACQQTCPSRAIVFGDSNDPESQVTQLSTSPRAYTVLADLNTRPSVTYLASVRSRPGKEESSG